MKLQVVTFLVYWILFLFEITMGLNITQAEVTETTTTESKEVLYVNESSISNFSTISNTSTEVMNVNQNKITNPLKEKEITIEEDDVGKLQIQGITIEDILKKCRENSKKSEKENIESNHQKKVTSYNPNVHHYEDSNKIINYDSNYHSLRPLSQYFPYLPNRPFVPKKIPNQDQQGETANNFYSPNSFTPESEPIKLIPTILQKVILKDGQILYYLPRMDQKKGVYYNDQQVQASQTTNEKYKLNITKTEEYISSFFPFPILYKGQKIQTINKTEMTGNPTSKPNYEINFNSVPTQPAIQTTTKPPLKTPQLKFVLPFHVCKNGSSVPTIYPNQIDPYAYLPKPLQPSEVNIRVPYTPTYHAIKTLRIPGNIMRTDLKNVVVDEN